MAERHLRPATLSCDPGAPDSLKVWRHWKRTFQFYIESLQASATPEHPLNKLAILISCIDASTYEIIQDCEDYESAIQILQATYDKPKNEVFARYLLSSCKQEPGQSLDQYLQRLKTLAKECNFKTVTAEQYKKEAIRDAFISGLSSTHIRQRLLERTELSLETAFDHARSLDMAEKQSQLYRSDPISAAVKTKQTNVDSEPVSTDSNEQHTCAATGNQC